MYPFQKNITRHELNPQPPDSESSALPPCYYKSVPVDYLRDVQLHGGQDDRVERGHGLEAAELCDGLLGEAGDVVDLDGGVREQQVRHHPLVPGLAQVGHFAAEDLGRAGQDFGEFGQVGLRREVALVDPKEKQSSL